MEIRDYKELMKIYPEGIIYKTHPNAEPEKIAESFGEYITNMSNNKH